MNTKEFIKYLEEKGLAKITQHKYLESVKNFFIWTKTAAEQVTKPDILRYLEYLKNKKGVQNVTRKHHLVAINHYFTFLYKDEQITSNPCAFLKLRGTRKKRLHKIYTFEELETLFDNFYNVFVRNFDYSHIPNKQKREQSLLCKERNALILSIIIYQRATAGEIEKIEMNDIDLFKANIKIRGSRRSNDRILPLNAIQIGLLMQYLQKTRPQMLEYQGTESEKLFLSLSGNSIITAFNVMAEQIKTIDKHFLSFKQLRASVITNWLKTTNLRKTQYLAGHRFISSTESYLINNLDGLIDDINNMHPFN